MSFKRTRAVVITLSFILTARWHQEFNSRSVLPVSLVSESNSREGVTGWKCYFFAWTPYLSAAIGQRPRNYLCCSCCCCSPFGSFPHLKEIKKKNYPPVGIRTWDLQIDSLALYQLSWGDIVVKIFENYLLISKISPQTLDQYWSTLVYLIAFA